ncbi:hypothetical protein [Pedobacter sp. D749]|uniref:hypothetical protein n=1 Tax=Pedobacter sp. D749 TaxID=2856523 RepID=UPI001C5668CF|nr:hypothetical protein [Pedobacter sp. D749]QXU43075.1 hypothetical protein KYH19_05640 [Pedobacter sp. D749]
MEKYITGNSKWLCLIIIALCLSCAPKSEKSVPQDILVKSTGYTIRKYKRYLYPKVYILKNAFTEEAKTVKVDGMELNLTEESSIQSTEASTIEFYKFAQLSNGDAEVELVLMPRRQYLRLRFKKTGNKSWEITSVIPWQV